MNLRFIDWIWHVRGSLALPAGQSGEQALDRLDPFFRQSGTTHERANGALTFHKKDPAAQDRMSIFNHGSLRVEQRDGGAVLRYNMTSRTLLFCFLAPLMFLGFAQLTIAITNHQKAAAQAAAKEGKGAAATKKAAINKPDVPMNPIDKALGAPAAEKPDKKKDADEDGGRKKPSTTPAYVFAAMFATLYVVGRILEEWLIRMRFRKSLLEA